MSDAMKASIVGNVVGALLFLAVLYAIERAAGKRLDAPGFR